MQHIWCIVPCMRDLKINCYVLRSLLTLCSDTLCGPCFETIGLMFSRFKFFFISPKAHSTKCDISPVHRLWKTHVWFHKNVLWLSTYNSRPLFEFYCNIQTVSWFNKPLSNLIIYFISLALEFKKSIQWNKSF